MGLEDPPQAGIVTSLSETLPTRLNSWSLKNNTRESSQVRKLFEKIAQLAREGVTLEDMMHMALSSRIVPLQARGHPMYEYTGDSDPNRAIRGEKFYEKSMREVLSLMFKGKTEDFPNEHSNGGFIVSLQVDEVSVHFSLSNPRQSFQFRLMLSFLQPYQSWAAKLSSSSPQPEDHQTIALAWLRTKDKSKAKGSKCKKAPMEEVASEEYISKDDDDSSSEATGRDVGDFEMRRRPLDEEALA